MDKKALITGITGQDGAYLAEFLLEKGYEVHGIKRRASSINTARIDHLYTDPHEENARLILHYGDMTDSSSLQRTIQQVQPEEIYNLAAQSFVGASFEQPIQLILKQRVRIKVADTRAGKQRAGIVTRRFIGRRNAYDLVALEGDRDLFPGFRDRVRKLASRSRFRFTLPSATEPRPRRGIPGSS